MPATPDPPPLGPSPTHWRIIQSILARHVPAHTVWAFGSRARGASKRYSDLALAIITDSPLPWRTLAQLTEDFTESGLPWRVDVMDWAELPQTLRDRIAREHVVIHEPAPSGAPP